MQPATSIRGSCLTHPTKSKDMIQPANEQIAALVEIIQNLQLRVAELEKITKHLRPL